MVYGWSDGGGGPTREQIENLARLGQLLSPDLPSVITGSSADFLQRLEGRLADQKTDVPGGVGEIYAEFHRGVYTSQARIKRANRLAERDLHNAEIWLASICCGTVSPTHRLN